MKIFISKLMVMLSSKKYAIGVFENSCQYEPKQREVVDFEDIQDTMNQLVQEMSDDCCEWQYDVFEESWETSCGTSFTLHDDDKEVTHYCPHCGKRIKIKINDESNESTDENNDVIYSQVRQRQSERYAWQSQSKGE